MSDTWRDKYQLPQWQKKAAEIKARDKWTCQSCGTKDKRLDVDHAYYEKDENGRSRDPWDYPNELLLTLCKDCHEQIESCRKLIKRVMRNSSVYDHWFIIGMIAYRENVHRWNPINGVPRGFSDGIAYLLDLDPSSLWSLVQKETSWFMLNELVDKYHDLEADTEKECEPDSFNYGLNAK